MYISKNIRLCFIKAFKSFFYRTKVVLIYIFLISVSKYFFFKLCKYLPIFNNLRMMQLALLSDMTQILELNLTI